FGGFSPSFFEEYERAWPLPAGHKQRIALYQLYHVLNHLNLFGSGYLGRAEQLIDGLLSPN
ncbi:MAG: fructosamine kinase family protein, partial [Woeseiaceae bacterium]|nr:fructosamine kinase family protein [Woeseiaceae bacterium]